MCLCTDVRVTFKRVDGKVVVWIRSETCDPKDRRVELQPESEVCRFFVSEDQSRTIMCHTRVKYLHDFFEFFLKMNENPHTCMKVV